MLVTFKPTWTRPVQVDQSPRGSRNRVPPGAWPGYSLRPSPPWIGQGSNLPAAAYQAARVNQTTHLSLAMRFPPPEFLPTLSYPLDLIVARAGGCLSYASPGLRGGGMDRTCRARRRLVYSQVLHHWSVSSPGQINHVRRTGVHPRLPGLLESNRPALAPPPGVEPGLPVLETGVLP